METEKRFFDISVKEDRNQHAQGMAVAGIALNYNDTAQLPWGRERAMPGCFGKDCTKDVILNAHHDRRLPLAKTGGGGLLITDSKDDLRFEAEIVETECGKDIYKLIKNRILTGASIEFVCEKERYDGDTRIIEKARLLGIGIVDRGAYPESMVQSRMRQMEEIRKTWRYYN